MSDLMYIMGQIHYFLISMWELNTILVARLAYSLTSQQVFQLLVWLFINPTYN